MIIKLIKRYRTLCSALSVLLAMIAAPYLLPVNPDSMAFRSGTFGLFLLIMTAIPHKRALERHSPRALAYGAALAFIFSICLSLGSELRVYSQLLPGFGSMIRRLAVPCMTVPLLGGLFSYLFFHLSKSVSVRNSTISFFSFFMLFACCYSAILLALYPGVISYDFQHEIKQFSEWTFQAAHPVFHTLFLGSLFKLGEWIWGSMTAGAAFYNAVQMLLLAAMLAWACTFLQKRVPYRWVVLLLAACFAFLPMHGVLAVSTSKDPLFAGLCTILCLQLWEIAECPQSFLASKARMLRFALTCLFAGLLRHNGIFAYAPACIALLLIVRRKKAFCAVLVTLLLTLGIPKGLETMMHASKTPSSEMMSIPCQQLMRTAHLGNLPEDEFIQIERWFPNATHTYRANCADPAKGGNFNFYRYQNDPMDFWTTYIKYALKYPRIYAEAFLENCIGLWYPDDISHAHTLSNEEWTYIYLNTTYPFAPDTYPIEPDCKFPALQKILYASTHYSKHQACPFLSQLFCPATYSFLLLLTTLLLLYKKQRHLALCTLPMWGIFISLLFSAGIFIRYAYPLMTCVPLLFSLACFGRQDT